MFRTYLLVIGLAFSLTAEALNQCEPGFAPNEQFIPRMNATAAGVHASGEVEVSYVVAKSGIPTQLKVLRSTNELFNGVAQKTVSNWVYPKRGAACKTTLVLKFENGKITI